MAKPNLYITFRVTPEEKEILQNYSERTGRAQSDVLREFIRNLETYCLTESAHDESQPSTRA